MSVLGLPGLFNYQGPTMAPETVTQGRDPSLLPGPPWSTPKSITLHDAALPS